MSKHAADPDEGERSEPRVIFRDKRKLDPETGEIRTPAASADAAGEAGSASPETPAEDAKVAELQADLQRLGAEYANYRKRTERDRVAIREQATGQTLAGLLPVLDDIERAREHGDLTGAFASVADSLSAALAKAGLTTFGEVGDEFNPNRHEAVMHSESAEVTGPTCVVIMRRGYQLGERLLRPAMVGVADPEPAPPAAEEAAEAPSTSDTSHNDSDSTEEQ